MLPSEGFITTPDGVRLFFQKLGSNPNALIIPNAFHLFDSFRRLADSRTVIAFDARHRGNSDCVTDRSKLVRGIHHDVDDLEAVRLHFKIDKIDVIGHSYAGLMVILYALKYAAHVNRMVQIGPMEPRAGTQYPAHLTGADATFAAFLNMVGQPRSESEDPKEACRKFWEMLRIVMVANPADADKIHWTPCECSNEVNLMPHLTENIFPSIQGLHLTQEELSKVNSPVLTIHGRKDRQAPYGGGREWALMLPNARLITVEDAAHVPWIEAPELVFSAIETFLDGGWPEAAQEVNCVDPSATKQ
jgi:pimeloyl-ACP methyl ester carboxylesterase